MSEVKLIKQYEEVSPLLRKYFKLGLKTNHFMTEEEYRLLISQKNLYYYEWDGGIIFLKKREADFKLTYQLIDLEKNLDFESVKKSSEQFGKLPIVMEIVQRPSDKTFEEVTKFWQLQGFESYLKRVQMNLENIEGANKLMINSQKNKLPKCVTRFCNMSEQDLINTMLHEYFNIHTGCIPSDAELASEIESNNIIGAFSNENKLLGILHFSLKKSNVEIRHLVVEKDYRNQGVASELIKKYHTEIVQKRASLWVTYDNEVAQSFYKKNGYGFDGWKSEVLIYKNN